MNTKSAFIAIVGKANVGKSSLLNVLLGEKIAIVSSKPQTTRTRITGVLTEDEYQWVFLDTPGVHKSKTKLSAHMNKVVSTSVTDVDLVIFMVEPMGKLLEEELTLLEQISVCDLPTLLVINKIDLVDEEKLLSRIHEISSLYNFSAVVPVSVKDHTGITDVMEELRKNTEEGPHFFPDDTLTDQPERTIASELIREKLLLNLRDEIPHGIAVDIEKMRERETGGIMDIEATIYCEKDSHKGMVIGKGGAMLKKIGSEARADLEEFLETKINLKCWVKVRDDWRNNENAIKQVGLRYDQ